MVDSKVATLIRKLHERSGEGRIEWKEAAKEGAYQASFPRYSITVSRDGEDYTLSIFNADGEVVEEVSDRDLGDSFGDVAYGYNVMTELYSRARRHAMGAAQAVDDLLSILDKDEEE